MYNKQYHDYIALLRRRRVRPPFERMEELLSTARPGGFAFPRFGIAAGALLGVMVFAVAFLLLARTSSPDRAGIAGRQAEVTMKNVEREAEPISASGAASWAQRPRASLVRLHSGNTEEVKNIPASSIEATMPALTIRHCAVPEPEIGCCSMPDHAALIGVPPLLTADAGKFLLRFGLAANGGWSGTIAYRLTSFTDVFLGVGYQLTASSSIGMLIGTDVFPISSGPSVNSLSFRDTSFVHNGLPYQNILGNIASTDAPVATRSYWLGASYRYSMEAGMFRPFAEVIAGGSQLGFISHQSIGTEIPLTESISVDLMVGASELLASRGTWVRKAGCSADASYEF